MALVAHLRGKWLLATEILGGMGFVVLSGRACAGLSRGLIVIIHLKKLSGALVAGFTLVLLIHNRLTSYSGLVRLILLLGPPCSESLVQVTCVAAAKRLRG